MVKTKAKVSPVKPSRFVFIDNNFLKIVFYCVLYLAVAIVVLVLGAMIGYSVLGDGKPLDVLNWGTWEHIMDFLK